MERAGARRRRDTRADRRAHPPGRDDAGARRARRGVHPLAGRRAHVQGLPRLPRRRSARRRTRWSCTASPARTRCADGDVLSVDVGVTLGGFVGDSAFTFPVGEISDEAQRLLEVGQAALAAGIEQAAPRQPPLGHRPRRPDGRPRKPVSRSSAASSVTASAGRCTRIRRSRTSASRAAAPCSSPG